jgi:hypothetical protein
MFGWDRNVASGKAERDCMMTSQGKGLIGSVLEGREIASSRFHFSAF